MITTNMADEYFQRHLKAPAWSILSVDKKDAALKMATDDVCLHLDITEVDETNIFQMCAVYEQAVFLAENYDRLAAGNEIESEDIDGIGSRKYRSAKSPNMSQRAMAFLLRVTGSIGSISRG
jgi:hypothetical protein